MSFPPLVMIIKKISIYTYNLLLIKYLYRSKLSLNTYKFKYPDCKSIDRSVIRKSGHKVI